MSRVLLTSQAAHMPLTNSNNMISHAGKSEGLGMQEAVGHIDFYPNGGQYMPGCGLGSRVYKILSHGVIKGWSISTHSSGNTTANIMSWALTLCGFL